MTALLVVSVFVLLVCAIASLENVWPQLFERIDSHLDKSNQ